MNTPVRNHSDTMTCLECNSTFKKGNYNFQLKSNKHLLKTGGLIKYNCDTSVIEVPQACFNNHKKSNKIFFKI